MEKKAEVTPEKAEKEKKREKKKKDALLYTVKKNGKHVSRAMNLLRVVFYPWHLVVFPYRLFGYRKAAQGPFIYVGNHYTIWDVIYPARTTGEGVHFLAKDSVMKAPVVGYWATKAGAIGAMRDGSDVRTLMDSMKVLRHGDKISLFPEGTRNKQSEEEFLPFHGGAALLAIKTKTPVIPFVICNRPRVFHMTHVVFGEPMELSEYYDRKLTQEDYAEADEKLVRRLYALREEHREALRAKRGGKKA